MKDFVKGRIKELLSGEFYCGPEALNRKETVFSVNTQAGLGYECLFQEEISSFAGLTGFDNSPAFDENGVTAARAAFVARDQDRIVGVAGAALYPAGWIRLGRSWTGAPSTGSMNCRYLFLGSWSAPWGDRAGWDQAEA